jgi:hypothetical protein
MALVARQPAAADGAPDPRAAVHELARRSTPAVLARQRALPLMSALHPLLGPGLRRGSTITVAGSTSLLLALAAAASGAGSWVAAVGMPTLGLLAAAELGVVLDRFALVPDPGREWPTVTAALVDAFDIVLIRPPPHVRPGDARRLATRARERGAVLLVAGAGWPGPDVHLSTTRVDWTGLDAGHGYLRARRMAVRAEGRRDAARRREAWLWLPGPDGGTVPADAPPMPARAGPMPARPPTADPVDAHPVERVRFGRGRRQGQGHGLARARAPS